MLGLLVFDNVTAHSRASGMRDLVRTVEGRSYEGLFVKTEDGVSVWAAHSSTIFANCQFPVQSLKTALISSKLNYFLE